MSRVEWPKGPWTIDPEPNDLGETVHRKGNAAKVCQGGGFVAVVVAGSLSHPVDSRAEGAGFWIQVWEDNGPATLRKAKRAAREKWLELRLRRRRPNAR